MKGAKILLVDDDIDFCKATSKILENDGYEVSIANDAKNARQQLKSVKPDLIILDIMLPGQDGFSLCREFKENTDFFEIPILILTSVSAKVEGEKYAEKIAQHHKADGYAEKPVDPKELLTRIYALLTKRKITVTEPTDKRKVLIIDSDRDFLHKMSEFLKVNGFEVQVTDTAKGGIRMVKAMSPDLILMDVMLPDRDGFSVSHELKTSSNTYNIPIVAVSDLQKQFKNPDFAYTLADTHKIDELISKPINPNNLLSIIKKYIHKYDLLKK